MCRGRVASDHSFKVALNVLRDARIKIVDAKTNSMNAPRLETIASTGLQDNTIIAIQVDSSSLLPPADHQKAKTGESCAENNISKCTLDQSSS